MKKNLLLTGLFALAALTANADTKIFYQDDFSDESKTMASWTTSRPVDHIDWSVTGSGFISTPDGNYIQFGNGTANYNGTRFSTAWGEAAWEGVTVPATGYTVKFSFNFAQFGNQSSNAAQRNNEIAVISAASTNDTPAEGEANGAYTKALNTYWGTAATSFPDYLFKMTQCTSGSAAGEGGVATSPTGTCFFVINNENGATDSVNVAAATWYTVTLNIVGQKVDYSIIDIAGTPLKSGSYTLADGADNRAGGILHYQARYLGISRFMNISMSYEVDGDVANAPNVNMSAVQGNDRVFKATFAEGETLHYIVPGGEEQVVDYWDAEDPVTGDPGSCNITVSQSGELSVWTTKGEAVSEKVTKTVEAGWITLVDPVANISYVSEGYGKKYKISIDNTQVLLSPSIALTYVINYTDGTTAEGEISNGDELEVTKAGTVKITANSIPVAGVEQYKRSSITIENDVEYVVAQEVNYINWDDSHFANNPAWEAGTLVDTNTSHWIGHWMNPLDKDETEPQNKVKNYIDPSAADTPLPIYTLINDEAGANYAKELLPLIPNTARGNIAILLEEGIFVNGTGYNNLELTFDPAYVTDDASKPNFIEIRKTNNYDRYDKGKGRHTTDIRKTDDTSYTLYRFDTAIHSARIFTYKGFTPKDPTAIQTIATEKVAEDAPVYNLNGVRVEAPVQKGIYIKGGKKFVVK